MYATTSAAANPASWRIDIGVVPAWLDWPTIVSSCQEMPWTLSTAPIVDVLDLEDGTLFDVQLDERRGG